MSLGLFRYVTHGVKVKIHFRGQVEGRTALPSKPLATRSDRHGFVYEVSPFSNQTDRLTEDGFLSKFIQVVNCWREGLMVVNLDIASPWAYAKDDDRLGKIELAFFSRLSNLTKTKGERKLLHKELAQMYAIDLPIAESISSQITSIVAHGMYVTGSEQPRTAYPQFQQMDSRLSCYAEQGFAEMSQTEVIEQLQQIVAHIDWFTHMLSDFDSQFPEHLKDDIPNRYALALKSLAMLHVMNMLGIEHLRRLQEEENP